MAIKFRKQKAPDDLGFGNKIAQNNERLINPDGSMNVERKGRAQFEPYMWLIETSWLNFFAVTSLICLGINLVFALGYLALGIENITLSPSKGIAEDFADALFFSIQTFTTVGYGALNPHGMASNTLSAIDALVGLLTFALATGLFFGRVSKPKPQLMYSSCAVLRPFNDGWAFMFRVVNGRNHKIVKLKAQVMLSWWDDTENPPLRRFYGMPLEREAVALLPLSWTVVNELGEEHPFFGKNMEQITAMNPEIIIQIEGYDQTFNQMVYSNYSYIASNILWNHQFLPMFESKGTYTELDLNKLSATAEMEPVK